MTLDAYGHVIDKEEDNVGTRLRHGDEGEQSGNY